MIDISNQLLYNKAMMTQTTKIYQTKSKYVPAGSPIPNCEMFTLFQNGKDEYTPIVYREAVVRTEVKVDTDIQI